jgi:hypothetical protein
VNTVWIIITVIIILLLTEVVALLKPEDNWWTITAIMRRLPKWAAALIMFVIGVLFGHFWWT